MESHILKYQQLSQQRWDTIHARTPLAYDADDPIIPAIRERLSRLGDLKSNDVTSTHFDSTLTDAVRFFQWRHGLPNTGIIDSNTLKALNVNPAKRLRQMHASLAKWQVLPKNIGARYIHINVPAYEMNLVENGNKVLNMKVVVGRSTRPTPEIYSKIKTLVLNPTWNVPKKLAAEDIVPKQMKDPNFLKKSKIQIFKDWSQKGEPIDPSTLDWNQIWEQGFPYHFTQSPGYGNSLGKVKFLFNNRHGVYMHDTPKKYLFQKIKRAYSSGCIRLEKPFQLAEYFLQDNPRYDHQSVTDVLTTNKTTYIKIKNPIPVYITYITAWIDKNGHLHFREDIYGRH